MLRVQTGLWKFKCMPELSIFSSFLLSFFPFFFDILHRSSEDFNTVPQIHGGHFLLASYKWDFWFCCRDLDVQLMFYCWCHYFMLCCFAFWWHLHDKLTFQIKGKWEFVHFVSATCLFCLCMCSHDQQAGWHCHAGLVYRADVCHCFTDPGAPHCLLHKEEQRRQISR